MTKGTLATIMHCGSPVHVKDCTHAEEKSRPLQAPLHSTASASMHAACIKGRIQIFHHSNWKDLVPRCAIAADLVSLTNRFSHARAARVTLTHAAVVFLQFLLERNIGRRPRLGRLIIHVRIAQTTGAAELQ